MKIGIFLFGLAALLLAACEREQVGHQNPHLVPVAPIALTPVVGAENPLNPYDSVGAWHNRILDSLKAYVLNGGDRSTDGKIRYVVQFTRRYLQADVARLVSKTVHQVVADSSSGYVAIIKSSGHARVVNDRILEMLQLMTSMRTTPEYGLLKLRITGFEQSILQDRSLDERQKAVILMAASIARHSSRYWLGYERAILDMEPASGKGFWAWVAGAFADVGAGVVAAAGGDKDVTGVISSAAATSAEVADKVDRNLHRWLFVHFGPSNYGY